MGEQITRITTVYKIDTETQAVEKIESERVKAANSGYKITKGDYTYKTKKSKGEVVDSWYLVTIQQDYEVI